MKKELAIIMLLASTCTGTDLNSAKNQKKASIGPLNLTVEQCKQYRGRIINNLSGREKCDQDEILDKVIGMDCPCICCHKNAPTPSGHKTPVE